MLLFCHLSVELAHAMLFLFLSSVWHITDWLSFLSHRFMYFILICLVYLEVHCLLTYFCIVEVNVY